MFFFVFVSTFVHARFLCLSRCLRMNRIRCPFLYFGMQAYPCRSVYVRVSVLSVRVFVCCVYRCMSVRVCVYVCLCVSVISRCLCVSVYVGVCLRMSVCICVY